MKVKALLDFTDSATKQDLKQGEEYEYEEARAAQLIRIGFVAKVSEKKEKPAKTPAKKTEK